MIKLKKDYYYSAVILCLIGFVYHSNILWLIKSWNENPSYSHGPLIPIISMYCLYRVKDKIMELGFDKGQLSGLFIIAAALIIHLLSLRMQVNFISSYSLILLLAGVVIYLCGYEAFKIFSFPLLYLVFMVPMWVGIFNKVSNSLKMFSSVLSYNILKMLGIPIYKEGVVFHLVNGSLEVADPCSGIRSLLSLLALATIIAYFSKGNILKKTFIVLLAIPIAIFWNTIRVVFFGLVLETTGVVIADGFWHSFTGLMVFAFAMLSLILIDKWINYYEF